MEWTAEPIDLSILSRITIKFMDWIFILKEVYCFHLVINLIDFIQLFLGNIILFYETPKIYASLNNF